MPHQFAHFYEGLRCGCQTCQTCQTWLLWKSLGWVVAYHLGFPTGWQAKLITSLDACVTFLKVVSWPGCVAIIQLENCKLLYCLRFYCFHIIPNCFAAHSCDMDRYGAVPFSASACNWDTQISTHLPRAIGTDTRYDI